VILLLGVVQIGLMVREQLHLELTVREAAMAAARASNPTAAAAAVSTLMLDATATDLVVEILPGPVEGTEMVKVQITMPSRIAVPLIAPLLGSREVTANVTMAREPP
jgi:Flp pilus assembly protein TadG